MAYVKLNVSYYLGESTDAKPTDDTVNIGAIFYETDILDEYIFNTASKWVLKKSLSVYTYDIAGGKINGRSSWSKIGYNGDVDAGIEDMWTVGGEYVFPTAPMQMMLVSSSGDDTSAGTGVRTVMLYYLDGSLLEKSEAITLSGVATVTTVAKDIYRVQNLRATTTGTGKKAAGDIDVEQHLTGSPIYTRISTGHTRARTCVWTVPKDTNLYVTNVGFSVGGAAKEKAAIFTTLASYDNLSGATLTFLMPLHEMVIEDETVDKELTIPTKLGSGVDLKVRTQGLVADCVCSCALRGWLESV
jgi:hypothetical protein